MVFINGNNNLDRFATENILAMEEIGSNDEVNIVVQYASYRRKKAVRMLIEKGDGKTISSPVLQDLGLVDMGDYRVLEDFIDWSVKQFPADHYFVTVWNHGSGWKKRQLLNKTRGISYDDLSGNHITTEELGYAMAHAAHTMGHKVDIYGSDACLMGMAEVANEMSDYVKYFAGSQDLEPGEGWPYKTFLQDWTGKKNASSVFVLKSLAKRYLEFYSGMSGITMSAYDLSKLNKFNKAIHRLAVELELLGPSAREAFFTAAHRAQTFTYNDYVDLVDLMQLVSKAQIAGIESQVF